MIKFKDDSNNPIILIPEDVSIKPSAAISDSFFDLESPQEGWRCIFPNLFLDVDGEIIELLFSVAGTLGNLSLYNLVSPESIEKPEGVEITAEFVSADDDPIDSKPVEEQ